MGYDPKKISKILSIFLRTVFSWQRLQARRQGIKHPQPGAVPLCQRYGSLLQFSPHFHCWIPEGVFYETHAGQLKFARLPPPDDRDVELLTARIAARIEDYLDVADPPELQDEQVASLSDLPPPACPLSPLTAPYLKPRCANIDGTSLHADRAVEQNDRNGLERGLRYGLRYPFAQRRLSQLPDGRVRLELRRPLSTGQAALVMQPLEFLRRLAATVPPRRLNMVRFHGVFAPRARVRPALAALLPEAPDKQTGDPQTFQRAKSSAQKELDDKGKVPWSYRRPWAELLKRVWDLEIMICPKCGDKMRSIAHIEEPEVIAQILGHLGLPSTPPPIKAARAPPQLDLDFVDDEVARCSDSN